MWYTIGGVIQISTRKVKAKVNIGINVAAFLKIIFNRMDCWSRLKSRYCLYSDWIKPDLDFQHGQHDFHIENLLFAGFLRKKSGYWISDVRVGRWVGWAFRLRFYLIIFLLPYRVFEMAASNFIHCYFNISSFRWYIFHWDQYQWPWDQGHNLWHQGFSLKF